MSPGAPQELGRERRRVEHLLEVVEYEQQLLAGEVLGEDLGDREGALLARAHSRGDLRGHERGVGQRREEGDEGAVGERGEQARRDLEGQACLAGAAGPGQGHEPRLSQELDHLAQLVLAPDEGGELGRQVVRPGIEAAQGGEVGRQARGADLEQALGAFEVLETVLAEVS